MRRPQRRVALRAVPRAGQRADAHDGPERAPRALDLSRRCQRFFPSIHADDAAAAVVAALDAPTGTYDVVDDEPLRRGEQRAALAAAVGRRRLIQTAHPEGGRRATRRFAACVERALSRRDIVGTRVPERARRVAATVKAAGIEPRCRGGCDLLLWFMAIGSAGVHSKLVQPRSFYDDFPLGRGWVSMDGPYNEHLVRDVGSLNLAIVVLVLAALFVSTRSLARVAAVVYLVNAVPHFVYHSRHINMRNGELGQDRNPLHAGRRGVLAALVLVLLQAGGLRL
jgi:hypothetical protein